MNRTFVILLAAMFETVVADAQPSNATNIVRVTLDCRVPNVQIVLNGDDVRALDLTPEGKEWTGTWRQADPLPPAPTGSLHLFGARTGCRKPHVEQEAKGKVAVYNFHCDEQRTKDVKITSSSKIAITYFRAIRKTHANPDSFDCALQEWGAFEKVSTIKDWRSDDEDIHILLFSMRPDPDAPGILFNPLYASSKGENPYVIDENQLNDWFCKQHAIGGNRSGSAPNFSPNACEGVDDRRKGLTLTFETVR